MRFVEWFSGIGAFRLGLERAGHECVGACEVDPKCRRVYEARFGATPWFARDILDVRADDVPEADLWVGGSPCQGFSPAGKRGGLADPRSGLLADWVHLLAERRPRWWLMENVPDLLAVRGGRDFGRLLAALDDAGYVGGWAVLDARWFGVPQRRRRLFVLARLAGEGPDPAEVLALADGGGRHPPARKREAADAPDGAAGGAGVVGALGSTGRGLEADGSRVVGALVADPDSVRKGGRHGKGLVVGALGAAGSGRRGHRVGAEEAAAGQVVVAALSASVGGADDNDARGGLLVAQDVASAITASAGHHGRSSPRGDPGDNLVVTDIANALSTRQQRLDREDTYVLQCGGSNVGEVGALRRGNGNVTGGVPFTLESAASTTAKAARAVDCARALDTNGGFAAGQGGTVVGYDVKGGAQGEQWHAREADLSCALQSKGAKPTGNEAGTIVAFDTKQNPSAGPESPSLGVQVRHAVAHLGGVRRLTPLECEKLMGLPPGWTCTCGCDPYSTAACRCPDGPRYAMVGNALVVQVAAWIGRRLADMVPREED